MNVELPDLGLAADIDPSPERELSLAPPRARRAGGDAAPIRSTVLLGGPDVARMQPRESESPELADRRAGADFWSVMLSLTFKVHPPERVCFAWLLVDLASTDGGAPPVAFAMTPGREEESVGIEATGGVELPSPLKVSAGRKQTFTAYEPEILALGRLRSDPAWELRPSSGRPIAGGCDFVLVVKAPASASARGVVSFGATIEAPRPGLLSRRRQEVAWQSDGAVAFALS